MKLTTDHLSDMSDAGANEPPMASRVRWSTVATIGTRAFAVVRGLVLARLLTPRDFGLLAGAAAFAGAASLMTDTALRGYLVHFGERAVSHARSVGRLAVVIGVVDALALVLAAPFVADLLHEPRVQPILIALAVGVAFSGCFVVPSALLRVNYSFRDIALAQLVAEALALTAGVATALAGAGAAALVVASLTSQLVTGFVLLWRYRRTPSRRAVDEMDARESVWRPAIRFSAAVTSGSLLWALALQGDNVVVGRILGSAALGLYAFAFSYGTVPASLFAGVVSEVAVPSISRAEHAERSHMYLDFTVLSAALLAPLTAVGVAFARPAVFVFLGHHWLGAARPLQVVLVLSFVRAVYPAPAVFRAYGRVGVEPLLGVFGGPATVVVAIVAAEHGLVAVATSVTAVALVCEFASATIAARMAQAPTARILVAPAWPMVTSAIAALAAWRLANTTFTSSNAVQVFVIAPATLATSVALLSVSHRCRAVLHAYVGIGRSAHAG